MRAIADACLSAVLAPPCAVCRRTLTRPLDGAACEGCWSAIRPIRPPVCRACGDPLPSRAIAAAQADRCLVCASRRTLLSDVRAAAEYEGTLRAIVHALKYDGRVSLARPLAALMRAAAADLLADADAVVPVPLHARRRRHRGFNQARLIAAAMGPPVWDLLARVRATTPQADLPADAREANVAHAFTLRTDAWWWLRAALPARIARRGKPPSAAGAVLVLIDDVATTGATLEACARTLMAAGAREVRAVTAARVVSRPPTGSSR